MKVGFIAEGGCERIVLRSSAFQTHLVKLGVEQVGDVIDIDGKGNLKQSSQRMQSQVQTLRNQGAQWVIVLRDLDEPGSAGAVAKVKAEVYQADDIITCLAIQELEAWFLADSAVLSRLFGVLIVCEFPQLIQKPSDYLNDLRMNYQGRGIRDKKGFASTLVNNGFTIESAAQHPNCPSALYFLTKLQTLASAN